MDDAMWSLLRHQGDPKADDVVAQYFERRALPARDLFVALVAAHAQAPADADADADDAVAVFLADRPPWPDWADPILVARGQAFFEQWGPQILPTLMLASLPEAYGAARGVQVLQLTARLVTDPRRRVVETAQMTIDAMTRGGLALGSPGYESVRRVRLMHAAIRWLIEHDPLIQRDDDPRVDQGPSGPPRWSTAWGRPINQEDLFGTLSTFTAVTFGALGRSGVAMGRDDAEAYAHTWSLVAYLLGLREDLLPLGVDDLDAVLAMIRRTQLAPSGAGHELVMALDDLATEQTHPRWLLGGLPRSTMRYLIGPRTADLLGLPSANWTRLLFEPARRVFRLLSMEEQHDRLLRSLLARLNAMFVAGFIDLDRRGEQVTFALPTHLADAWAIPVAPGAASGPAGATETD